jgi:enamine deaminase RidA (YjgF/YER057c/UK114 family)
MSGAADERLEFHNPPELAPPPGYSNVVAVRHGSPVFIAGQVATDAKGSLVGGNDFRAQAEQAFRNLGIALASGLYGASFSEAHRVRARHEELR